MCSFPVKITRWRRISHKRLDFTAAALYDKFPGSAWIGCRAAKPLSHAFIVSHFTFKTWMSVNSTTFPAHNCHWAENQIFNQIKEQKNYAMYDECAFVKYQRFLFLLWFLSPFSLSTIGKPQWFPPHCIKQIQRNGLEIHTLFVHSNRNKMLLWSF